MYRLSPVTYFVSTLLSSIVGEAPATCSPSEISTFDPPAELSCGGYLVTFIKQNGGQLLNPDAAFDCQYCRVSSTTAVLARFEISFEDRWWQWGCTLAYSLFNVCVAMLLYWAFRVPKVRRRR